MTDDQLAEQLHELKRRNETPIPLIEICAALARSETERKTEAQEVHPDNG